MPFIDVLKDNLSAFSNATNITLNLLDPEGHTLETFGPSYDYCKLFAEATGKYCPCFQMHHHSCAQAAQLGEDYIFSCPGGLIHFTVPIFKNNVSVASVLAGPIALEYADMTVVDDILQKHNISLNYRGKMYTAFTAVPLIEPYRARHMTKLLFLLISNLASHEAARMEELASKTFQQAKIGEYIQLIKEEPDTSPSQYTLEKTLISYVLAGNMDGAKGVLNEMLGRIYFASGNSVEIIKTRTIELIALLSRAIVEGGGDEKSVYHMTDTFLHAISSINDLTDLSYILLGTLEKFTNLAFANITSNNLTLIRKSVQYMNEHYNTNPSLEEVAHYVGLNAAYFSTLFKKEMGINFSNYIVKLKVEQGKRLLKNSNLPLITIAVELGFDSQSYFSNVFKKHTGMTPKQYRQSL